MIWTLEVHGGSNSALIMLSGGLFFRSRIFKNQQVDYMLGNIRPGFGF